VRGVDELAGAEVFMITFEWMVVAIVASSGVAALIHGLRIGRK
jgi:1-aminocyclopropane-1-carboxylate deaminase/D-cysteine desulfhydrase-like pyridoxal-dependent ACC family enzyme